MKKWYLLFLPLVLIGAGCSATLDDNNDDVMVEGDEMMIEDHDGDDMMVEDDGEMMEDEDSMMEDEEDGDAQGEEVSFDVAGVNFAFDVEEIRVNKGDTVTINFTSTDGFHDWVVDEFDAATEQVNTGGNTSVTFVADEAGEFEYYCSVGQHRANGMVGTLIVE